MVIVLAVLVIGASAFCVTGGPGGKLEFRESGKNAELGSIRLSKMRCLSKRRVKGLLTDELGIKYTKTKKAKTEEGRGVEVMLFDDNGQELFYGVLTQEQPELFGSEIDVEYLLT